MPTHETIKMSSGSVKVAPDWQRKAPARPDDVSDTPDFMSDIRGQRYKSAVRT